MEPARPSDLPEAPPDRAPRYCARPLPAYRYVPGHRPHPVRDPAGHSFAARSSHRGPWQPGNWERLDDWLFGVDLFNRFYFWEAHEAWEGLWAASPRDEAPALLLQGLIQIAAALLKLHLGAVDGAQTLAAAGIGRLQRAAAQHRQLLGLDLAATVDELNAYFEPLQRGRLPRIDASLPVLRLRGGVSVLSRRRRR
jgi:predicted metal-dependent hydrolase